MLTLITVNFNNARDTISLLKSLETQTDANFDIIVVDNNSFSEDRALLGEYGASSKINLDIIYSEENRGFAGGNNLALRKALQLGSEWLLLINNDTVVQSDFIEKLKAQLPDRPSLVAVPLAEENGTAYGGIVKWLRATLRHEYSPIKNTAGHYVIGAGILGHRDVFERTGLLDESYFLYFEDADFSAKVIRAGIPIKWLREPIIQHQVSGSTKSLGSPLLLRYHMRNALIFNRAHGPWFIRMILPLWALWSIIKQLVKIALMPARKTQSRAILAGIIDFYKGKTGKIKNDTNRH